MRASPVASQWHAAATLVAEVREVLDGRPEPGCGPSPALARRGWDAFLLSLDDAELEAIEARGAGAPWPARTPPDLRAIVERARSVCDLPLLSAPDRAAGRRRRGETPRKRAQIEAFGRLVATVAATAARVVDVGSGHGHLTRDIAARVALPVVGLERDATLAGAARRRTPGASPAFTVTDVLADGLTLSHRDCLVGLHACGELGDAMVTGVARASGHTLALVGCCPQKRLGASRSPLCALPGVAGALDLPRGLLGLCNLAGGDQGVEASRADNLRGRERRLALHRLLARDRPLPFGAEIQGLNRRTAQKDLATLVGRAFAARGMPPPARSAIDEAARWARAEHARSRRLSVPRVVLARALEVYVLLDRAAHLEAHGYEVAAGVLFPASVSPRNLALVAWNREARPSAGGTPALP